MTTQEKVNILIAAMKTISVGRTDNGRALAADISRQIARAACLETGLTWGKEND